MSQSPQSIDPSRTALLVMDFQNGIIPRVPDPEGLLSLAEQTLAQARRAGMTIGYVRVGFADGEAPSGAMARRVGAAAATTFHADAESTQIHDRIRPHDDDIVVRKTRVGAFSTTDLDEQLRGRGVDSLLLAGISTSGVVLSTVRDAHDRDYRIVVLADVCADPDPEVHAFLTERIFPGQADVITSGELSSLLR